MKKIIGLLLLLLAIPAVGICLNQKNIGKTYPMQSNIILAGLGTSPSRG
jgi:hypothetical protein